MCKRDHGTSVWVRWGNAFKAAFCPFCLCCLPSNKRTVGRSTGWRLSGTSHTWRWQLMERLHTCFCCFHYPSAGHWPHTKSLLTELHLLSPCFGFYCVTQFPFYPFLWPHYTPVSSRLSLLKWTSLSKDS